MSNFWNESSTAMKIILVAALASVVCGLAVLCVLGVMMPAAWAAEPLRVVTTVSPITDMARQVGGSAIELHGMVPEGVNSHTFRPTPRDVAGPIPHGRRLSHDRFATCVRDTAAIGC